jgi:hypothetical protein
MIAVTPPEVLTVADALRRNHRRQVTHIRNRAIENADRVANMDREQYEAEAVVCPLLCEGNRCAANGMRPIHCRGWLPIADQQTETDSSTGSIDIHAHTVGRGTQEGLARELNEHGLDGNRYELNSALAVAIEIPNAAELWAKRELIFQCCRRYEWTAPTSG